MIHLYLVNVSYIIAIKTTYKMIIIRILCNYDPVVATRTWELFAT